MLLSSIDEFYYFTFILRSSLFMLRSYTFMWERTFCFNCSTNYYVFNVDILSWFHIHFMSALVCYYLNIFITHSFLSDFFLFFTFHSLPLSCVLLFHLAFTLLLKEEERWEIRQRHARVYTYSNIFCNDVLFIIVQMIRSKKMREVSQ